MLFILIARIDIASHKILHVLNHGVPEGRNNYNQLFDVSSCILVGGYLIEASLIFVVVVVVVVV